MDAPLFGYNRGKKGPLVPLTADVLANKYKEWVKLTGRQSDGYTLHGLRQGGVNHALTMGLCGEDIMIMGDWASTAYMQYIDLTLEWHVTNMVKFVDEMDHMLDQADDWEGVHELNI